MQITIADTVFLILLPVAEWFINGKPMQAAARYQATYDFGFVSLDCTHCYAEDSGIYMCRATNAKGSATTTGTLTCISKANLYFDTQHPQGRAGLEAVSFVVFGVCASALHAVAFCVI